MPWTRKDSESGRFTEHLLLCDMCGNELAKLRVSTQAPPDEAAKRVRAALKGSGAVVDQKAGTCLCHACSERDSLP